MAMKQGAINLVNELHLLGIWRQDILAILYDLKPCSRFGFSPKDFNLLRDIIPRIGLKMAAYLYPRFNNVPVVLIGKDHGLLKKAQQLDLLADHEGVGRALGYPQCCINRWLDSKIKVSLSSLARVSGKGPFDFHLNFLYNFESRIFDPAVCRHLEEVRYQGWDKYLIYHVPCSLGCLKSIQLGKRVFALLKEFFPDFAGELKFFLHKTMVIFDDYSFIALEAHRKNKGFIYRLFPGIRSIIDEEKQRAFCGGNSFFIKDKKFYIKKDKETIISINPAPLIFSFS